MPRKPAAKPKAPKQPPNLQALIRKKALHATPPTDTDLSALAIAMLFDLPDDQDHHAGRASVKLGILKLLHQINQDNRVLTPVDDSATLEAEVRELLAKRKGTP